MSTRIEDALETGWGYLRDRTLRVLTHRRPLPPEIASWAAVFCGASVGRAWHLPWVYPTIETLGEGSFDKRASIDRALARQPQAIFVKECAAYFPAHGGTDAIDTYARWMDEIDAGGIVPIVVTVVPVTRAHAIAHPGRAEGLWAFNDALRALARGRQLPLLDLERALRISANDRHLRDGLDVGDGLHLRYSTYRAYLDHLIPVVLSAAWRRAHAEIA